MQDSTTTGQRFTQLIQQLGLTKNAFAQSLGKTATVIQHIVDERNKPGYDLLNKVCEVYPNVSSDWLLLGRGTMLREQNPQPLFAEPAASAAAAPVPNGIDPADIPHAASSRRRAGALLQPADIAATLKLAAAPGNGRDEYAAATAPAEPAVATAPAAIPSPVAPAPAVPPVASSAQAAAPPIAPSTAPDPAYLAAALHTMQLQHQLALSEQRNQHLLEQQALLKQMVQLLQAV